ncbi:DUF2934 domain-containing protein [Devosia albogilva]|uniref:DUF2934 domain-containing protein n=1 Tax=Devosia albogilva TaxID=429726 RepID=A0ABW5QMF9_9HYPH
MAQSSSDPWGDQDFELLVREVAYALWERDGRPEGQEKHYWFRAIDKCMQQRAEEDRLRRGIVDPM